jgi:quinone-modifying oxidoreductase, subunit QmoB
MAQDTNVGAYICTGCGIGDALDCSKLLAEIATKSKPTISKCKSWLCGAQAIEEINDDNKNSILYRIAIGACSPRFLTYVFRTMFFSKE